MVQTTLENQLFKDNPLKGIERLKTGEALTPDDVAGLWSLLRARFPETKKNAGIFRHLALTAAKAARIAAASRQQTIAPADVAAMGLLRNLGMLLVREYFDKSVQSAIAAERLEIHERLRNLLLPPDAYVTPDAFIEEHKDDDLVAANVERIQKLLSVGQRLLEMAGLLAKQDKDGRLLTFGEVLDMHQAAFTKEFDETSVISPSSLAAQKNVRATRLHESYTKLYDDWYKEFVGSGVPMNELNAHILEDALVTDPKDLTADALMESTIAFLRYAEKAAEIIARADALMEQLQTATDATRPSLKTNLSDVRDELRRHWEQRYPDENTRDERDDFAHIFTRIRCALETRAIEGKPVKICHRKSFKNGDSCR